MQGKILLIIISIIFALLLLASCDIQTIYVTGEVYLVPYHDDSNEALWESLPFMEFYYKDEIIASSSDIGKLNFEYDISQDITYFLDKLTVEEPYKVKEIRDYHVGKRQFEVIILITVQEENGEEQNSYNNTIRVLSDDEVTDKSKFFHGYVSDLSYDRVNTQITFGTKDEVIETDEEGNFSFYYVDYNDYEPYRLIDYLQPDIDKYKYRIFTKKAYHDEIYCVVIVDDKNSQFDMNKVVTDIFIRCSFDQSGVILPEGYPSIGKEIDEKVFSVEGSSTMYGVKLYIDDKFVIESNICGFELDFLIVGASLKPVEEGFTFKLRRENSPPQPIESGIYIFDPNDGFLEFRGHTEDKNIFIK